MPELILKDDVVRQAIDTAGLVFQSRSGALVAEQVADLVDGPNKEAYFVPGVKLIVDATLAIVRLPEIESQLPREVKQRQASASFIAEYLGKLLAENKVFGILYSRVPTLKALVSMEVDINEVFETEHMASLGGAPFFDTRLIAGGAYRMLEDNNVLDPVRVIQRSTGLLKVAKVFKHREVTGKFHEAIGLPYARADIFELHEDGDEVTLTFTPEISELIESLHVPGRGCPVGRITSPESGDMLLKDYWTDIVAYLLPEDATLLATLDKDDLNAG